MGSGLVGLHIKGLLAGESFIVQLTVERQSPQSQRGPKVLKHQTQKLENVVSTKA